MEKVRLGIIGIGNMGSSHIKNALEGKMPEIEITAVADIKPDRLEWAKEQLPDVKTFKDASELMDSGEVDAVSICTYNATHAECAIYALEHGVHVLLEKPMCVTLEEAVEKIKSEYWIDVLIRISTALTKIVLGRIRTRFTQSNALWSQDGERLLEEGNIELKELREVLRTNSNLIFGID